MAIVIKTIFNKVLFVVSVLSCSLFLSGITVVSFCVALQGLDYLDQTGFIESFNVHRDLLYTITLIGTPGFTMLAGVYFLANILKF